MSGETVYHPAFRCEPGLGLSTCYGIVKQNRGYISFWSEPGRGTSVEVFLPMVQGTQVPEKRDCGGPLPKGKETILVVEDEPTVRGMIRRILAGNGYRVLEASGGAEAFEAVRKAAVAADVTEERVPVKKLDLLLTDVVAEERFSRSHGPLHVGLHRRFDRAAGRPR